MKTNTILIIISSLIVAAGAYWYFFMGTGNESPVTATESASDAQIHFEGLVSQLSITFNTAIFSDPRFNALVDITVPVAPETAGRLDPLAPIPGVTSSNNSGH